MSSWLRARRFLSAALLRLRRVDFRPRGGAPETDIQGLGFGIHLHPGKGVSILKKTSTEESKPGTSLDGGDFVPALGLPDFYWF